MFKIVPFIPTENSNRTVFMITTVAEANADEVAALNIPKYVGKITPNYGFTIDLTPNATTGEVNERGIKRVAAFLAKAAEHCEVNFNYARGVVSIEDFCNYHGIDV